MIEPYQVADETFVIPHAAPVPGVGQLPINAMVIRGEQPMLVDTLATVMSGDYLEAAWSLVDPEDVQWLFISHEDRDHSGSLAEVMAACPNAKLITNFLGLGKLSEEFVIPPQRAYLLNSGDTMDLGDRKITALRPPLYDSSATRGFWDPKTEVYFAADCFGVVQDDPVQFTDELSDSDVDEGYYWMNRANHAWFGDVKQEAIDRDTKAILDLNPKVVVSGHGPTARENPADHVSKITKIGGLEPIQFPSQEEFEKMLAEAPPPVNPPPMTG